MRLVHYLVKYGYYNDVLDVKRLLESLLGIMDGRNDSPYPQSIKRGDSKLQVMDKTSYELQLIDSPSWVLPIIGSSNTVEKQTPELAIQDHSSKGDLKVM